MIHIACSSDDYYVPHCGTMLHSFFSHNADENIHVHFLCESLSSENQAKLTTLCEEHGVGLSMHYIPEAMMKGLPVDKFHPSCWYRIFLPDLLPDLDRILYLDADMVILDCVREIWDSQLGENILAAVVNPLYPFMGNRAKKLLGESDIRKYLNSGVMVMDLEKMRQESVIKNIRDYAIRNPQNMWPEQDALSVICRDRWLSLPARWNAQTTVFDVSENHLPFEREEIKEAKKRPAIVHFIGPLKPWHYRCRHPYRTVYKYHRKMTPWPEYRLDGRSFWNFLVRWFPYTWQWRLDKQRDRILRFFSKKDMSFDS